MSIIPNSPYDKYKRERLKLGDAIIKKEDVSRKTSLTDKPQPGGYKTKHTIIAKGPMYYGTIERRRRRKGLNDEDLRDVALFFGSSSGEGVSKVSEETRYYENGTWY